MNSSESGPSVLDSHHNGVPPKSWLVESILATIFCCMPFGLAGIVHAAKVEAYAESGEYDKARYASKEAKKWTLIALGIGFVSVVVVFLFYGAIIMAAVAGG
jgi:hypothetical protein